MGDSKMMSLVIKTMETYENQLVKKLVMAGRFSAMCSSKTRDKKGVETGFYKGIAVGIMKYNSIVNELTFLRIIKEMMSVLKMGSFRKSSMTRKLKRNSKLNRSIKSIRKSMLRIPMSKTLKSRGGATANVADVTGVTGASEMANLGELNDVQAPPLRKASKRWSTKTTMTTTKKNKGSYQMGQRAKYIAAAFSLVLFVNAIAMVAFGGSSSVPPPSRDPFARPGDINTILNIQMGEEAFENAYRWSSGKAECGVFSFADRTQEEHDRSAKAYRGMMPNDACIGKSSLQGQSDVFSRDFIPYANELILDQRDICRNLFNAGFKSYIASSKIWNSGKSVHVKDIGDMKVGLQWQQDIISNLCDDHGSFGFKNIDGNDKLSITMVDPRTQNHYIDEFTQILNELSMQGHINSEEASDFLLTIAELRELPVLPGMMTDKFSGRISSDAIPLGDKLNGVSQVLINYNSKVSKWTDEHRTMVGDGYNEWNSKRLIGRTDEKYKTKRLVINQRNAGWALFVEEWLGPLFVIAETTAVTTTKAGVTITASGTGAVTSGASEIGGHLIKFLEKMVANGFTMSIVSVIILMIGRNVGGGMLLKFVNIVLVKFGMAPYDMHGIQGDVGQQGQQGQQHQVQGQQGQQWQQGEQIHGNVDDYAAEQYVQPAPARRSRGRE